MKTPQKRLARESRPEPRPVKESTPEQRKARERDIKKRDRLSKRRGDLAGFNRSKVFRDLARDEQQDLEQQLSTLDSDVTVLDQRIRTL